MEGIFSVLLTVLPPIFMVIGVLHDYKKMNREWSDLLKRQTEDWKEHCKYINKNWSDLCKQLDAGEVKHGKWEIKPNTGGYEVCMKCSVCAFQFDNWQHIFSYCPVCGAKMDGDNNA